MDIEVDCCQYAKMPPHHKFGSEGGPASADQCDSGYSSGFYSQNYEEESSWCRSDPCPERAAPRDVALEHSFDRLKLHDRLVSTDKETGYHFTSQHVYKSNNNLPGSSSSSSSSQGDPSSALSIFSQDEDGDTQLHMAIIKLQVTEALQFILQAPTYEYLNIGNYLFQTPLHLTIITKQYSLANTLIEAGANLECRDHQGNTPMHIACKEGDIDGVHLLLRNAANRPIFADLLELRNYDGVTCLHLAVNRLHLAVIRALLVNGANINAQDGKSGRTVLHYAVESGNKNLIQLLFDFNHSLNINARTYSGMTPLLLARGRKDEKIVEYLLLNGAEDQMETISDDSDSDSCDDFFFNGKQII